MDFHRDCYAIPGLRIPFGKIGSAFASRPSYSLGVDLVAGFLAKFLIDPHVFDGIVVGEIYTTPTHPNPARYIALKSGFRDEAWGLVVSNNCASGLEAVIEAARQIMLGESDLILVLGQESTTNIPVWIQGALRNHPSASVGQLMANLQGGRSLAELGLTLVDGSKALFVDPTLNHNLIVTAELLAQNYDLQREELDAYVIDSHARAIAAWDTGQFAPYIWRGPDCPDRDENLLLNADLVRLSSKLQRVPTILGNGTSGFATFYHDFREFLLSSPHEHSSLTTTVLNCASKADGAAIMLVASAQGLNRLATTSSGLLEPLLLKSWGRVGVKPEFMGLGMANSALHACGVMGIGLDQIDLFEFHEAYSASLLAVLALIKQRTGVVLRPLLGNRVNPNGGSLATGHALGAAGVQLFLNTHLAFQQHPGTKRALTSICAGGGVGVSIIVERP